MAEIKTQETAQLQKLVGEKREALRVVRFGAAGSRSRNVRETREMRREIARSLTELSARKHAEKVAPSPKKA